MKQQKKLFKDFAWGFVCLAVVCLFPAIAPFTYFINNETGIFPYVLVLVAGVSVIYEFFPFKNGVVLLTHNVKIELMLIIIPTILFMIYDFILLMVRADQGEYLYEFYDYCIMGYVILPIVITVIEIIKEIISYLRGDDDDNGEKIATPLTSKV